MMLVADAFKKGSGQTRLREIVHECSEDAIIISKQDFLNTKSRSQVHEDPLDCDAGERETLMAWRQRRQHNEKKTLIVICFYLQNTS